MEKRTNQEYTIMDSLMVGDIEYVLAERLTHLDRYVVWECLNGTEYRQGDYTSSLAEAHGILYERAEKELRRQRDMGALPPASVQMLDFEKQKKPCLYLRPLWPEEQKYAFAQSQQIRGQCGSIGRLQGDFGDERPFHRSFDTYNSRLATEDFGAEMDSVIRVLGQDKEFGHLLKTRASMKKYCAANPESRMAPNLDDGYGFRMDTGGTAYLIRCNPVLGEHDFFIYAYKADWLDKHMENASFGIQFIDSRYTELFRIKDGENICITYNDGEKNIRTCRYIDETHMEIGSYLYHICEFAERMEQSGNTYLPAETAAPAAAKGRPRKSKPNMER